MTDGRGRNTKDEWRCGNGRNRDLLDGRRREPVESGKGCQR